MLSKNITTTEGSEATAWSIETMSDQSQLQFRSTLQLLFQQSPLPTEDLLFNLGLFLRTGSLVKLITMAKLYERFAKLPGSIMEFGVWWGQNLVLYENLRAIYEPFNKQRQVIGFDTFSGYTAFSPQDKPGTIFRENSYSTPPGYERYLSELLATHEGMNVLGHLRDRHRLIRGNVVETAPRFFEDHPETLVAFAYFDLGLYEPTKAALRAIEPHLMPGSIILFDELTWSESPGEAIAMKETLKNRSYTLEKLELMPLKTIAVIQ